MGLFIIGGMMLAENKCLDIAEEMVEKNLVLSDVELTADRLERWQAETKRCIERGADVYGYLLEQYGSNQTSRAMRSAAFCGITVGGIDLNRPEVLDALIELSRSIHRDDISSCDEWLLDNLGVMINDSITVGAMEGKDRKHLTGIAKSAIRQLQHYAKPTYFSSEEQPNIMFVVESATLDSEAASLQ